MRYIDDISEFIFLSDVPEAADVIFVPGNGFAQPAEQAARLFHAGLAKFIVPSGRFGIARGRFVCDEYSVAQYGSEFETEWAFMREILLRGGVPDAAILREDRATYTWENAQFTRGVLDALGMEISSALLCCNTYHARRCQMYYETVFPGVRLLLCPVVTDGTTKENWHKTPAGIRRVLGELERCGGQFGDILKARLTSEATRCEK